MSSVERLKPDMTPSGFERFEPQPLPEELAGFQQNMKCAHAGDPFYRESIDRTLRRVQSMAAGYGSVYDVSKYQGYFESRGLSIPHEWIAYKGRVIDLHLPVNDPEFPDFLHDYMFSGDYLSGVEGLEKFLRPKEIKPDLGRWVLGEFPERYDYLGTSVALRGIERYVSSRSR